MKTFWPLKEKKSFHAFTLMEIMVVIIILGVLAGLAIPRLGRVMEQSRVQDAMNTLISIHAAQQNYRAHNGSYWPTIVSTEGLAAINQNLGLNIAANPDMTYFCTRTVEGVVSCSAVRGTPNYTLTVRVASAVTCSIYSDYTNSAICTASPNPARSGSFP